VNVVRAFALLLLVASGGFAETAKRLVVIKVDGLPADFLARYIDRTDPSTGRYLLPWFHGIFIERGAVVDNFYVRGISLSAPSWSLLDTGRHLTIRGNAEFDRYYPRVYDYLNFFPFYVGSARSNRADMPGAEALDECGIPLLIDRFPYEARYEGMQLFQRGVHWRTLSDSLKSRIAKPVRDLIDEWQTGFDFSDAIMQQQERELIAKLADPAVLYLDYYTGDFDHVAHLTNDESAQLNELRSIDATVGHIWTAIGASPLAAQTVLALVSDHGMNSTPGVYSQGYDLVHFFNSPAGGAHHVITNRHPRDQYKLRGLDPFVSYVRTPSPSATYLADDKDYPTALLDLDGNERASVQLRNSDLNEIHILLKQLGKANAAPAMREAMAAEVLRVIDRNRVRWSAMAAQLHEELPALHAALEAERQAIAANPHRWSKQDRSSGLKLEADRLDAALDNWQRDERGYSEYLASLEHLMALKSADLVPFHAHIEALIPKGVMGEPNSVGQMQRYIAGPAPTMSLTPEGALDEEKSFLRINYFAALTGARVRNAIEKALGPAPVDFVAAHVAPESLRGSVAEADLPELAIFLYRNPANEAILLAQHRGPELWLKYLPVSDAAADAAGQFRFTPCDWKSGLPLNLFEDPDLQVTGDRAPWLNNWHSEREWFDAVHRTRYSNAVIGLDEYFRSWKPESLAAGLQLAPRQDWPTLMRFMARVRRATEPDLLVLANYGWNFNVRSFNPGGNHGSFFRISTHSVLMFAGAGVPAGLRIEEPYDSLNFVPAALALLGQATDGYPAAPIPELAAAK
jgi:hypothetical protein